LYASGGWVAVEQTTARDSSPGDCGASALPDSA
jgi:hypothetical protein